MTKIIFVGVARQVDLVLVASHPPSHPVTSHVPTMLTSLSEMEDGRLYSFSIQQSAWHLVQKEGQQSLKSYADAGVFASTLLPLHC